MEMQPGKKKKKKMRRRKMKGRKYRAEMRSGTQMATFLLTELKVWVRERAGGVNTPQFYTLGPQQH